MYARDPWNTEQALPKETMVALTELIVGRGDEM